MDLTEFRATLTASTPPAPIAALSLPLRALWWDGKGDWTAAHDLLQDDTTPAGSWVHAYLHRKEGDGSNAGYWYRRAGQPVASGAFEDEWTAIVTALL
jgi:hypothetical protein